jgi:signal peptidase II
MSMLTRPRLIGLSLAGAIFALDQLIKYWVRDVIILRRIGVIEILPFFDLRWTENYGVSLGMFTANSMETRWLLVAITASIAAVVLVWMLREKAMGDILALAMILGGAMGNIRDRMNHGFVLDYADLHFGDFRPFLIFNLADAAITIGVLIILARSFLSREKRPERDHASEHPTEPAHTPAES